MTCHRSLEISLMDHAPPSMNSVLLVFQSERSTESRSGRPARDAAAAAPADRSRKCTRWYNRHKTGWGRRFARDLIISTSTALLNNPPSRTVLASGTIIMRQRNEISQHPVTETGPAPNRGKPIGIASICLYYSAFEVHLCWPKPTVFCPRFALSVTMSPSKGQRCAQLR